MGRASGRSSHAAARRQANDGVAGALPRLQFEQSNRSVGEVVRWLEADSHAHLELNPPYQRGEVWTPEQKVNLLKSLIMQLPIGVVFINQRPWGSHSYPRYCVDGQQRLRALADFFADAFAIPTAWIDDRATQAEHATVPATHTANTILFSQLSVVGQRDLEHRTVAVYETKLASEREEAELYLLINFGGVAQTDTDRARAAAVAAGA